MDKRKVLFTDYEDSMLIITDATKEDIIAWIKFYKDGIENNNNTYFDFLIKRGNYVKVLFDSVEDSKRDDIDIIGYDEVYDLNDY